MFAMQPDQIVVCQLSEGIKKETQTWDGEF